MGATEARVRTEPYRAIWNTELLAERRLPGLAAAFAAAQPFPHMVIDDLFDSTLLREILLEFDTAGPAAWETYDNSLERKQGSRCGRPLPPATQSYFDCIYSGPFLGRIGAITGVDNLIVDPTLFGGGMHQMTNSGFFAPHLDFQQHPHTCLDNRAVLITFLNADWRTQYGGELVLYERDGSTPGARILPSFGRTILFLQTPHSVHCVAPISAPSNFPRRSLAAYYYSNGGLADRRLNSTTTIFVHRSQRRFAEEAKWFVKRLAPPILVDAVRQLRRKPQA